MSAESGRDSGAGKLDEGVRTCLRDDGKAFAIGSDWIVKVRDAAS